MSDAGPGSKTLVQRRQSIAIVGGGIAGLYAAYMLGRMGQEVQVFEVSPDHWGGRIESHSFDLGNEAKFIAEFGPMRFETDLQPRLRSLCFHLGIDFEPFSPTSAPIGTTHYDLTEKERSFKSVAHLLEWAVLRMFFEGHVAQELKEIEEDGYRAVGPRQLLVLKRYMDKNYFCDVFETARTADVKPFSDDQIDRKLDGLRRNARLRGMKKATPLAELGLWNALSEVLTPGALAYIRDNGTFYHFITHNPSALEWGIFWLRQASVMGGLSHFERDTAPEGTYSLIEALLEKIKTGECANMVRLAPGHEVVAIDYGKRPDEVVLRVRCGSGPQAYEFHQRADQVILALPQQPLLGLSNTFPEAVRKRLESVIPLPLLKAFLVTEAPWWKHHLKAQTYAWLVPTRELHYFRPFDKQCPQRRSPPGEGCTCETLPKKVARHGMIMLYTDQPAISYWQALMSTTQRSGPVWREYRSGKQAAAEVARDPDGLLGTLVRRLVVIPDPGLARKINLEQKRIQTALRRKDKALAQRIERSTAETLGLAERSYNIAKDSEDARTTIAPVLRKVGVILDDEWLTWLDTAIKYKQADAPAERIKRTVEAAEDIRAWGIRDWSSPPFGGAAHVWVPRERGSAPTAPSADPLIAFSLRGRPGSDYPRNVHVCGEAYSGFQGFIEGALRTAESVVDAIVPGKLTRKLFVNDGELGARETKWKEEQAARLAGDWKNLEKDLGATRKP